MKIIVLSISPYKEKDAVISAISEDQFITFLARGINNPTSKNIAINNPLTIADIDLMDGNFKHPVLKSSKQIFTPLRLDMDSKYLGSLLFINEIVNFLFPDEEKPKMFKAIEDCVVALKKNEDWMMVLLLFMAQAIRLGGFELEVNQCVNCGSKKNIVTFSFAEGGFICQNCYSDELEHDLTKNQMVLLRNIFNLRDLHLLNSFKSDEETYFLLKKFINFIEEAFGYHFKNLRLLID